MENEFISIAEAALLTHKTDVDIMRLLKDRVQTLGVPLDSILKKEQREKGIMLLINKGFLFQEFAEPAPQAEAQVSFSSQPVDGTGLLEAKNEMIAMLQNIIDTKDRQMDDLAKKIDELIERDRETNILLKGLQERMFLLEDNTRKTSVQEKAPKK